MLTSLPTSLLSLVLSFSISAPFLPIMIPGRAATTVTLSFLAVLSIRI